MNDNPTLTNGGRPKSPSRRALHFEHRKRL